jgi:hypothetical protein
MEAKHTLRLCLFAVKPVAVHITTKDKQLSADKRYDVECKSSGSRPEAVITWWKNSRQIKRITKNVSFYLLFLLCAFHFSDGL